MRAEARENWLGREKGKFKLLFGPLSKFLKTDRLSQSSALKNLLLNCKLLPACKKVSSHGNVLSLSFRNFGRRSCLRAVKNGDLAIAPYTPAALGFSLSPDF